MGVRDRVLGGEIHLDNYLLDKYDVSKEIKNAFRRFFLFYFLFVDQLNNQNALLTWTSNMEMELRWYDIKLP